MAEERSLVTVETRNEVSEVLHRLDIIRELREEVMREGVHFGTSPGTDTPALWQAGGDILKITFKLKAIPKIIERDPEIEFPHRGYLVTTDIVNLVTGEVVAEGHGSCSTMEKKHRWRWASRTCPACKQDTIRKGSEKYGGGWYCKDKSCRAKFKDGDANIEQQEVGSIENMDLADVYNTVLKVAKKRAFIDGILDATGAREQFMPPSEEEEEDDQKPLQKAAQKPAQKAAKFQPNQLYVGTLKEAIPVSGSTPGRVEVETEQGLLVCLFRVTPEALVSLQDWKPLKGKACSLSFVSAQGIAQMVDNFEILLDEGAAA